MSVETVRALPEPLAAALNAYRDRCWRGGDCVPERIVVEQAVDEYVAQTVSAALDKVLPAPRPNDDVDAWLREQTDCADRMAHEYATNENGTELSNRCESEYWANEARMFRLVRERLAAVRGAGR